MKNQVTKREAYYLQVYEIIKERILNRQLHSGERINEYALAQELNVSRSPVREALRMLERDELLVTCNNGLMINPLNKNDVRDIYSCRLVLESYACRLCCETITEESLDEMERYIEQSVAMHQVGNMEKVVEANTAFHNVIINSCPNRYLRVQIDRNELLTVLARTKEFSAYRRDSSYLAEHIAIIRALRERNGDNAELLMRRHIQGDMDFHLLHVSV